ncbi:hypothetical protein N0V82_010766 [Gnomoniopsis sp. IMI 355080]|nr:hypothetical protein N0V82_010766 [Gnomoniopsis sp. IMI 355080]
MKANKKNEKTVRVVKTTTGRRGSRAKRGSRIIEEYNAATTIHRSEVQLPEYYRSPGTSFGGDLNVAARRPREAIMPGSGSCKGQTKVELVDFLPGLTRGAASMLCVELGDEVQALEQVLWLVEQTSM